ncbi:hypothetical protein F4680DRAFT_442119 [Xylaria scruposa]|nr:hypothetical protein F4680DRAFT_442119 [Xylaria scruposa]
MSAADAEWKVIHYEDEEPVGIVNQLPIDGRASCLKVLVPHAAIKKYTMKQENAEGEMVTVLENPLSHVLCSIYVFYTDPEPGCWSPLYRNRADWDGLPAKDGYYTFYGLNPVSPLWGGSSYYHNLEFYDADNEEYVQDILYYSNTFTLGCVD